MKKFTFLIALAVLTASSYAAPTAAPAAAPVSPALPLGVQAIGWDNNLKHITARLGLTQNNAVDVGVGLNIDTETDVKEFLLGGFYLLKLQDWGIVDNYLTVGGTAVIASDFGLSAFAGMQPEITLLDRLIVSIRFGVVMPIRPDVALQTTGDPISIVNGMNFKLIW